jgi:FkbM family methyltransferase
MSFVSYAQNFEDVLLWRALKTVENGTYIDVGAYDPVAFSVSLAFYERGWRGVHVEPLPDKAQALRDARPDETVIEAVVGSEKGSIDFFVVKNTGLSTGLESVATEHKAAGRQVEKITVPSTRLSTILDQVASEAIHWLKIDVEGMERSVLDSWSPSRKRPWVVVVESTYPDSPVTTYGEWEDLLLDLGYLFAFFDGLNRYYVHQAHEDLIPCFSVGPNVFDDFVLYDPERERLAEEVQEMDRRLAQATADRDNLEVKLAELTRQNQESQSQLAAAEQQLADLNRTVNHQNARLVDIEARMIAAEDKARRMRRSFSWRATAPIREIGRGLRKAAAAIRRLARTRLSRTTRGGPELQLGPKSEPDFPNETEATQRMHQRLMQARARRYAQRNAKQ